MQEPQNIELTEQDEADLAAMAAEPSAEPAPFHPLLEVWLKILEPAEAEAHARIEPSWASRICAEYPQMTFALMEQFRDLFFERISELKAILQAEVDSDEDCLKATSPIEDRELNSQHYKNLLCDWQVRVQEWELAWSPNWAWAAADLAAISEVHKMFFSQKGLCAHLDNIGFEFTEADQQVVAEALTAAKGA
jgi:hypothetical protein